MQETILAISGKAGLFKLVGRGNNTLIVETIDETHRRTTAGARDRVTSLADVTMYTEADDVPLMQVFQNICDALKGEPTTFGYKTATRSCSCERHPQIGAMVQPPRASWIQGFLYC